MENAKIKETGHTVFNGRKKVKIYIVTADTERFGRGEIMFEGNYDACVEYLEKNGIKYDASTAFDNAGSSCFQMGNKMYHAAQIEGGMLSGASQSDYGRRTSVALGNIKMHGPLEGTAVCSGYNGRQWKATVKFGTAMVW